MTPRNIVKFSSGDGLLPGDIILWINSVLSLDSHCVASLMVINWKFQDMNHILYISNYSHKHQSTMASPATMLTNTNYIKINAGDPQNLTHCYLQYDKIGYSFKPQCCTLLTVGITSLFASVSDITIWIYFPNCLSLSWIDWLPLNFKHTCSATQSFGGCFVVSK